MKYRGCAPRIAFSGSDLALAGRLACIEEIVGMRVTSVDELESAFGESGDPYFAGVLERG